MVAGTGVETVPEAEFIRPERVTHYLWCLLRWLNRHQEGEERDMPAGRLADSRAVQQQFWPGHVKTLAYKFVIYEGTFLKITACVSRSTRFISLSS